MKFTRFFVNIIGMKIGAHVAVVDDDLRGEITSVKGELISFRDQYGFIQIYSIKDIVLIDQNMYENITMVQKQEPKKVISKKHNRNHFILDLHFEKLVDESYAYDSVERLFLQREKLLETLEFCRKHNLKKIEIIHGIGDGVLQKLVWDTLEGMTGLDFYNKEILHHQSGAIMVEFH